MTFPNPGQLLGTEQRLSNLEKRVDRVVLTVDGDVYNSTPSIRHEVRLLHQEFQDVKQMTRSLQHDVAEYGRATLEIERAMNDHNRRDFWIHFAVMVALTVIMILAIVALVAP